jgi:hypothetical protein
MVVQELAKSWPRDGRARPRVGQELAKSWPTACERLFELRDGLQLVKGWPCCKTKDRSRVGQELAKSNTRQVIFTRGRGLVLAASAASRQIARLSLRPTE